jgi:hypothetical protein
MAVWLPKDLSDAAFFTSDVISKAVIIINVAKGVDPGQSSNEHLVSAFGQLFSSAQKARESVRALSNELLRAHLASRRKLPVINGVKGDFAAALAVEVGYDVVNKFCTHYEDRVGNWGTTLTFNPADEEAMAMARQQLSELKPPDRVQLTKLIDAEVRDAAIARQLDGQKTFFPKGEPIPTNEKGKAPRAKLLWLRVILLVVLLIVLEVFAVTAAWRWGDGDNLVQKISNCWWLPSSIGAFCLFLSSLVLGGWRKVKKIWDSLVGEVQ